MKKVIVIEDDPMVAMINTEYLSQIENIEVVGQGTNKNETFNLLAKKEVDLILLDIYLGNENGIDILQEIRSRGYITDVIMITSANGNEEIKKALALGCVDYLIKPFDFERFVIAVEKVFQRDKLLKNEKINQHTIDNLSLPENMLPLELPKGLNENTLKKIITVIKTINKNEFGIKDICGGIKLSNVTVKKYLDYLESIKYIRAFSVYGNIGRPLYMYKKTSKI
ncbi:response regulator [Fusobacterium sp.]|uniref:response regulator n=1 Tax=Fusobacterium sp. TaxID=68766 RepID=UPI00396C998C